jgi:xanthine dehydrogenase accessory factor
VYDIAARVGQWLGDGQDPTVAIVVATRGFSSRDPGSAAAWTADDPGVGRLITDLDAAERVGPGLTDITIAEDDARAAGLACGGVATVFAATARDFPPELWPRLAAREPVCILARLPDGEPARIDVYTPATIRQADLGGDQVPRLFGRGTTAAAVLDTDEPTVVLSFWPVPTLVVVGDGLIADALGAAAALLGWSARGTPDLTDAVPAIGALHASDAVVVLSHDRDVDGPALAAALDSAASYVGALGSRRTQAARREWLTEHGVAARDQERIHGPAGLDIDAHTPAEIAVSIVAEILATRAGSTGGALRGRAGPVHVAGVQAPPPRY